MEMKLNDLHCHSSLSACCADKRMTPERILRHAEEAGYETICLTDHLWDSAVPGASGWYAPQNIEHVRAALPLPQAPSCHFYFGCETELPVNGVPALSREHFDLFDFVVIPVNHMHMAGLVRAEGVDTPEKMAVNIENRLENLLEQNLPLRKIGLAHLTIGLMFREGRIADVMHAMSEARLLRILKGYAAAGTGIELNATAFSEMTDRPDDILKIYRIAKEAGCRFYCSSDAHSVEALDGVPKNLPAVIQALGLTEADAYRI
ncbi:MAG: PHP domain-containing protein [Eubacteriales bacterium]|nr:PHP domain-containing protein [Eubacteriales bacterium]